MTTYLDHTTDFSLNTISGNLNTTLSDGDYFFAILELPSNKNTLTFDKTFHENKNLTQEYVKSTVSQGTGGGGGGGITTYSFATRTVNFKFEQRYRWSMTVDRIDISIIGQGTNGVFDQDTYTYDNMTYYGGINKGNSTINPNTHVYTAGTTDKKIIFSYNTNPLTGMLQVKPGDTINGWTVSKVANYYHSSQTRLCIAELSGSGANFAKDTNYTVRTGLIINVKAGKGIKDRVGIVGIVETNFKSLKYDLLFKDPGITPKAERKADQKISATGFGNTKTEVSMAVLQSPIDPEIVGGYVPGKIENEQAFNNRISDIPDNVLSEKLFTTDIGKTILKNQTLEESQWQRFDEQVLGQGKKTHDDIEADTSTIDFTTRPALYDGSVVSPPLVALNNSMYMVPTRCDVFDVIPDDIAQDDDDVFQIPMHMKFQVLVKYSRVPRSPTNSYGRIDNTFIEASNRYAEYSGGSGVSCSSTGVKSGTPTATLGSYANGVPKFVSVNRPILASLNPSWEQTLQVDNYTTAFPQQLTVNLDSDNLISKIVAPNGSLSGAGINATCVLNTGTGGTGGGGFGTTSYSPSYSFTEGVFSHEHKWWLGHSTTSPSSTKHFLKGGGGKVFTTSGIRTTSVDIEEFGVVNTYITEKFDYKFAYEQKAVYELTALGNYITALASLKSNPKTQVKIFTYLTKNLTTSATRIDVESTYGFLENGFILIPRYDLNVRWTGKERTNSSEVRTYDFKGFEIIYYAKRSSTAFLDCVRAQYGTTAISSSQYNTLHPNIDFAPVVQFAPYKILG